tara:strand:- start:115 stop:2049 length:1935 start_codon:yes stop_codon:yes gene_type:complete
MVDFTTKIEQNAPGITYTTPKAMPAKFNSLTSALKMVDKGIESATAFDKKLTIDEVTDTATLEAQQYLNQSPSEQMFLKERQQEIEADIRLNPDSPKVPSWKARLDDININLANAKEQGKINAYEFSRRSNAKVAEIIESNPAYRDEILTETQKVYQSMGLADVIAADQKLLKNQSDSDTRQNKELDKFLIDNKIFPYNKTITEKGLIVETILEGDRSFFLLNQMAERDDILDNDDKKMIQSKVENFKYKNEVGYDAISSKIFNSLGNELKEISVSDSTPEQKVLSIQGAIQKRRKNLNFIGRNYTKGTKDRVTSWYNEQIKMVEIMEKDSRELNSGEFTKKYLDTLESTMALTNKLELRQFVNPEAFELALKTRAFILKETRENPGYEPTTEEMKPINDFLNAIKSSNGGKVSATSNLELNNFYANQTNEKLRGLNTLLGPAIKNNTELDISAIGYMNNVFTVSEIKGAQEGDSKRMNFDDKLFTSLSAMDDNVINYFVVNQPDFRQSLETELDFYKSRTIATLNSIKAGQPDLNNQSVPVQFYKNYGTFSVPNNKTLDSEMQRVNKYISLKAKSEGANPKDVAIDILNKEFSMFSIIGQEIKPPVVESSVVEPEVIKELDDNLSDEEFLTKLKEKLKQKDSN